ncbi:MAG: MalY/PatB family protein [Bacillota bacterium]|nr:MalY/PatB family protein [Bacillota bacterium]
MKYDFDTLIDRRGVGSRKWEYMQDFDPRAAVDMLPFWIADMDFSSEPQVKEAIKQRVDRDCYGYTMITEDVYDGIIGWYERRFGWRPERKHICYSPGVVPAIGYAISLLTAPGDGVIIQPPVYYPFAAKIKALGRKVVDNPLLKDADGFYSIDFDDLEDKCSRHKLLILCSPHNPVGRVWTRGELSRIVDICKRYQVLIIADEIHNDLLRRGVSHQVLEHLHPEYRDHIVTCVAPSKTFNMAGLQFSNIVIADDELRSRWLSYTDSVCGVRQANALSIAAVGAVYKYGEPWLEQLLDYLDGNFAAMAEFVAAKLPRAVFAVPQGTYLGWLDLRGYGLDRRLFGRIITEGRVMMEHGVMFGESGWDFLRINVACPRSMLLEGLRRLAAVLNGR